jgi:hypothetical protein
VGSALESDHVYNWSACKAVRFEQYNVCGKPSCRCKDPKDPQKHGPYHQLSFTWRGKSRTRFVRAERLADMQRKIANYKRFRELSDEWVDLAVEREQLEREQAQ